MDSGQRFTELADAAPVLIWRAGPERQFDYLNTPWLRFTGRSLSQELGHGWTESVHAEDRERFDQVFAAAYRDRTDFNLDFRLRRLDGDFRWMMGTGRPFYLADGAFAGFLGSCGDITDRKEAEVNVARALAE